MKTQNILLMGAISLALLTGCGEPEQVVQTAEVVRPATLYTVADESQSYIQKFPALIEASNESDLSFRVSGKLMEVNVVSGTVLKKGDVIARIDPTDYKINVDKAEARYNLSLKTFERYERMIALKLAAQADYDQAEALMILNRVNLENARNNLSYTTLYAPFDGRISSVSVENFETVGASANIAAFQNEKGLDISFELPESILSRIDLDKGRNYSPTVVFTTSNDMKAKEFKAEFKEMDSDADPRSRSYNVILHMPKPTGSNLKPGMTATVKVELDQILTGVETYSLVPLESVFSPAETDPSEQKYAVWLVNPETMTVKQQEITVNGLTSKGMQVTSGLNVGDIVVGAGVHSIVEGTKVRAWIRERGI